MNKWIVGLTKYMYNEIINKLNCILIENQRDYNRYKDYLDVVIAPSQGANGPFIKYKKNKPKLKYTLVFDPWLYKNYRQRYIFENRFSYVLVGYYYPAIYHFKRVPVSRMVHFPWAVPDDFVIKDPIKPLTQNYILVFGESRSDVYDTRNCTNRYYFVKSYSRSGAYKVVTGFDYIKWLGQFDAIIAATSLNVKYRHVVAKYFEVPASGALLFAQEAEDLDIIGFKDNKNGIIFNKENFKDKVEQHL
ncbi:MAG: hypothetical protein ACTSO9_08675 [Candidatus Helarchaeota archaeon]